MKMIAIVLAVQTTVVVSVTVPCDHTTEVCECKTIKDNDDTCEFTLEIEHLQTFTRYQVTEDRVSRGKAERLWYINDTGDFQYEPSESNVCTVPIDNDSCTEPFAVDGYTFRRPFIAINGRIPGPTLIVKKDQYVVVKVINKLVSETVSMHWHGMHQRNSHWMDGLEHVTQCGILPGANFTYVFQAEQSGTHWYHSHSGKQRTEGMFGSLIVKENEARIAEVANNTGDFKDYPEQHTLIFIDWAAPISYFSEVGSFPYWSGLINGRGKHPEVDYIKTRLSIFTVEPNNVYRFRLIGAQSRNAYKVSIDEHTNLTVIASDGAFVNPITVDYIIMHSGERFDFLLETKSQPLEKQDFIIRAETLESFDLEPPNPNEAHVAEAILHYNIPGGTPEPSSSQYESISKSSIPVEMTCNEDSCCVALNCPFKDYPPSLNINCTHIHQLTAMFPLTRENGLPDTDSAEELFLNFAFDGVGNSSSVNARNFKFPSVPLSQLVSDPEKLKAIDEAEFCKNLENPAICDDNQAAIVSSDCYCTHVHHLQDDSDSVLLVLSAVQSDFDIDLSSHHPIHLHGHYIHVVDMQFGEYNEDLQLINLNDDIDCGGNKLCTKPTWAATAYTRNYSNVIANAPLKDTIIIPFGGYAVVYYTSNNPGYWFLHCHIESHQLHGMNVVIGEKVSKAKAIPKDMPQCGTFDFDVDSFKEAREGGTKIYNDFVIVGILLLVSLFVIVTNI